MATMEMATLGRTVLLAHAPGAIHDSDWSVFLTRMKRRDYDGLLVWAPQAAPNTRQRHSIVRAWNRRFPRVGIVTESATVKGVISVLSLFMSDGIRGFQPAHLEAALDHVGTPTARHPEVADTFAALRARVPAAEDRLFFAALRAEHQAALEAAARARCGSAADADDLVQETFELAFLHARTVQRTTNPRAWLKALLHHRFVSRHRRRAQEGWVDLAPLEESLASPDPEPEPAWASIGMEQVWEAAEHLDPALRRVFELYEREGLSYQEIARRLGIPTNTVGSRINRGRSRLRKLLRAELRGEETSR
jgi:RNA polymerase sigma-70 factor (ECF subfamily)